ncbi:methyltransferase RsmF C-terminal domain-like protein [Chryseolinea lacunae]|uniref:rRNA methyltransferase n=1 Tax=Chryseolinea lacunae TaxID=2801331 RepID=A0ABS1KTW9_9BACT|nr:rRNA methyltransferase [Chryseolinea lacunae]MBL0742906.1 rRNA methyltransferase [Chryseolinea lacunae]
MSDISFPPAFEQRMREQLGAQWADFEAAHHQPSPVSIRLNPAKVSAPPAGASSIPWTSHGYYLHERPSFTLDPAFHAGAYYVQEASSMFLEQAFRQVVDPDKAIRVLDLCAAPGGKSTHLLSLLNNQSLLVSNEVIRARASILAENIQKWGHCNAVVTHNDPQDFQRLQGFFDVMVVDAPCSGEGLFRKDPDAMQEWSPDNVALCSKRQRRILSDVWPALKEGGVLLYSTCTYNADENEANLAWLQQEHGAEFIPLLLNESWGIQRVLHQNIPGYRFYPHNVKGEGFFMAAVRKTESTPLSRVKNKTSFMSPPKKATEQLPAFVRNVEEKMFILRNDQIQFFPKHLAGEIEFLTRSLYLLTAGTVMATLKHDKLVPEHPLALSLELERDNFSQLNLELPEALQYLRKEGIHVEGARKGFALMLHNTLPLGWMNVLDNRSNNLYPSDWRIRKS